MKINILLILFIIFSSVVRAEEWLSPVDTKYRNKNPDLYAKFDKARNMLDSWAGQQEKLSTAQQILTEIAQADNEYAPAYREFGRLYIMAGYINYDNFSPTSLPPSEAAILKSIQIEPNYAEAYVLLGHLYTNMKRYNEAKIALQKAEMIGTKDPWLHLNWADLNNKLGDQEAAFKRYMMVVNQASKNIKIHSSALEGVETYYVNKGEYDKADKWYKKELAYTPENAWAWGNYSGFLLYSRHDVDGSIRNAEKALSIMDYGMGRFTLACALYTKWAEMTAKGKDLSTTQALFDRAYKIYPNIDSVIEKTSQYPNTKITSVTLEQYKLKNKAV